MASLIPAERLHAQAQSHTFELEALPWAEGVNPEGRFAPEGLAQLAHSPSWQLLDADARRLYGRTVGLALAEMFIFLEEVLLIPAVRGFMARRQGKLEPAFAACLQDFIDEEYKHSEMFWRLLETAAPERYPSRKTSLYAGRWVSSASLQLMVRFPDTFICWIWLALIFEERTLDLYRKHQAEPEVEPLFTAVHRAHMLDEARHVSIDQHILAQVWDPAPMWLRRLNVKLLAHILGMFTAPRNAPRQAIAEVLAHRPELRVHAEAFERDIAGLRENEAFQRAHYARPVLPRTFALLDRYPEMAGLRAAMPLYTPEAP